MFRFNDGRDWFFERRFGVFIHWGLYAIHAIQEQEQQRYNVPAEEYVKLINQFNPKAFDPDEWLDLAQDAGMEYMTFTSKHHDGFCLWDSKLTEFNVMNSPYGKDVVKMLTDACHRRSFPLEIYYSVVDWHHPAYPNIGRHHEINTDPGHHDWGRYMEFLTGQVGELCSNYGEIHGIWWDMNVPAHKDPAVHEMIRRLQPKALINNRGFDEGDYSTPERDFDPEGANPDDRAFRRPTEACQSVGVNSWGYRKAEDYFSTKYFMRNIDRTLAMGGNYLLNIGPDALGRIPSRSKTILKGIGKWMRNVRESFDAEPVTGLFADRRLLATRRGCNVYVHCPEGVECSTVNLRPFDRMPLSAILLNTGKSVDFTMDQIVYERNQPPALRLRGLDADKLAGTVPVFKLTMES